MAASLRRLSAKTIIYIIFSTFLALYLFASPIYRLGDRVRQTHPWSFQNEVEHDFKPTESELACLHGQQPIPSPSSSSSSSPDPIPNIVHFIYGLRDPAKHPHEIGFDFLCYLALRSAIVALDQATVYLHYTWISHPLSPDHTSDPLTNPWIKRLSKDITLVNHPPDEFQRPPYASGASGWQAAHISDIMRLQLLQDQGGIYMDIDAFALRPFTAIAKGPKDLVLGHEGGNRWGLCNAVMAARPNSTFVKRWLDRYAEADLNKEWNYHSVLLPKEMEGDYPEEVCALPPTAFFWPTWTWRHVDWMHQPLGLKESQHWKAEIERNGGSLFKDQLAYHAWNQMAEDRYLKYLTPKAVRTKDTRFNLLMRRFIEPDVQ